MPAIRSAVAVLIPLLSAVCAGQSTKSNYDDAAAMVRQGKAELAIPLLTRLSAQSPRDLRVINLLGIALSAAGRKEEAETQFMQALKLDPGFMPAVKNLALNQLALATGYANAHQNAKAAEALSHLPAHAGSALHFEAGLLLARLERYADAAREFELARPGAADPYQVDFNLALASVKAGNYRAAISVAERVIGGGKTTSEIYSLLSQALEGSGKTTQAYEALRSATLANPLDEAPYLELMALCAEHENFDLSLKIAGAGIHALPASHRLLIQRGIVLAMMARFAEAEKDFRSASELAPRDTVAPVARALVLMRTERTAEAVEDLRRQPDDYLVSWLLAEALTRLGSENPEAITQLEKSIRLNPEFSESRLLLGKLLLAQGNTRGAITQLEKSLQLDPANIPATYQLATAYRKNGETARSAALFATVSKAKSEEKDDTTSAGFLRLLRQKPR